MSGPALDNAALRVVLCDADGNLVPSEEHAFVPSTALINEFLARNGRPDSYRPEEMRRATSGMNFRITLARIAERHDIRLGETELELLVARERQEVTAHLADVLTPDEEVLAGVARLAERFELAAVSSSASARLDACFAATRLDATLPPARRFSAEDSLPSPRSKPDPAVYLHALAALGVDSSAAVAIEDAAPGVASATGAGIPTIGNLTFVPLAERKRRADDLHAAGAHRTVASWRELADSLTADRAMHPVGGR
jgi:beta-phosphoglucomutase-like phosphatase (HAD superfamily)